MKHRADSLFSRLKPAQRDELFVILSSGASLRDAQAQCDKWGVKASLGAVSSFYSRHAFSWRLERAKAASEDSSGLMSPEQIESQQTRLLAQKIFEAIADTSCPPKVLLALRAQELKVQELRLAERRVQVLEAKVQEATATLQDTKLTPEQREKRMKEVFGLQ